MSRHVLFAAVLILAACSAKSPLPDMQPGETGRVVRVIDGDALVLDTGQSVRLVSIEAPTLYRQDAAPDPYAAQSARLLEDLALGRRVRLYYPGITRDRYDRALAHVVTVDGAGEEVWLNQAMIEHGGAWVRLYPDTAARGQDLLALEHLAREARRGLWADPHYAVQNAAHVDETARGFVLVYGQLGAQIAGPETERFPPACYRGLDGSPIHLSVRRDARTVCSLPDGTDILVRGYVSAGTLDLTYPLHLEQITAD